MPSFSSQNTSIVDVANSIALHLSGSSTRRRFQQMYYNDRIAFVYDCMPNYAKTLTDYQEDVFGMYDSGASRVTVRGPHGLGKTFMASILVHHTVLTAETDCKVPTTASAVRQLEKYLWPEIVKSASNIAWPEIGRQPYDRRTEMLTQSIKLNRGMIEAFAVASDRYELIEGAHATRMFYIFDEAKTIPNGMFDAAEGAFSTEGLATPDTAAVSVLSTDDELYRKEQLLSNCAGQSYEVKVLAISTPGPPMGRFYDIHMRRPGYEDWTVKHVSLTEAISAGRISRQWAEQRKKQWGAESSTYMNRVLGEFADTTDEGVIPLSWVRAANKRYKEWEEAGKPGTGNQPRTVGVDTARMGDDSTVFAFRSASVLTHILKFSKVPTTVTAGKLSMHSQGYKLIIETDGGLGAAVYDMVREEEFNRAKKYFIGIVPVTVGGKTFYSDRSGELRFADVRSAMWWNMRELLDPDNGHDIALPPDELLTLDLITPEYETLRNGVIKLESKRSIRKKISRSTDCGDAVCLAFWEESRGGGVVF